MNSSKWILVWINCEIFICFDSLNKNVWVKRRCLMLWVYWFSVNQVLWLTLDVKIGNQWAKSVRSTINMQKKKRPREINDFFRFESNWSFCYMLLAFFFKLLVNRSILDFVLEPGKHIPIESKREYARTRWHMNDKELTERLQLRGPMKFIFSSELTC